MFPRKLDPSQAPISTAVGVMGMLGLTAYAGLIVQCQPQPGENRGGIRRFRWRGSSGFAAWSYLQERRVVAIAGSEQKIQYLHERRRRGIPSVRVIAAADLKAACPDGCDVYFENVGGHVFDAVLPLLNPQHFALRVDFPIW